MIRAFILLCFTFIQTLATPVLNVPHAKKQALDYHRSIHFEQECHAIVSKAIQYLEAHEHEFDDSKTIIFDVDDTILSNIEHVHKTDFCQDCGSRKFIAWVKQALCQPIPHIKKLYDYCIANKYHIIFLSSRTHDCYEATVKNLADHGYKTFDRIILRQEHDFSTPSIAYKSGKRSELTHQGLTIVACVGDQDSDFEGGLTGYCVKIPNYLYCVSDQYIAKPK